MGVPKWISFLQSKRYRNVQLKFIPGSVANLHIDANGLFHTAAQKCFYYGEFEDEKKQIELQKLTPQEREDKYLDTIIGELNAAIKLFKPTSKLVISVDGCATISKISQQRQRRFKNSLNRSPNLLFDSNAITPSTELMRKIDTKIKNWLNNSYFFLTPMIIYSNHLSPNEGETKIFSYLRDPDYDWSGINAVLGLDWDLAFLSLLSPTGNIYLSRKNENDIINIDALKIALQMELRQSTSIPDFCLMSMLIGTDFIPKVPSLANMIAAYDAMFIAYKAVRAGLTEGNQIIWPNFYRFITELAKHEKTLLNGLASEITTYKNPIIDKSFSTLTVPDISGKNITTMTRFDFNLYRGNYYLHTLSPKVRELTPTESKVFTVDSTKVEQMTINYLSMLNWNFLFYVSGPEAINPGYFYRYNYSPLIVDILAIVKAQTEKLNILEQFEAGPNDISFNPLRQLVSVIPPASKDVLPEILHPFLDFDSPLYDLFFTKFLIDMYGKNKEHEGVALLPPLDVESIIRYVDFDNEILKQYLPEGDYLYTHGEGSSELKEQIKMLRSRVREGEEKGERKERVGGESAFGEGGRGRGSGEYRGCGRGRGEYRGRGRGSGEYRGGGEYRGRGRGSGEYRGRGRGRGGSEFESSSRGGGEYRGRGGGEYRGRGGGEYRGRGRGGSEFGSSSRGGGEYRGRGRGY